MKLQLSHFLVLLVGLLAGFGIAQLVGGMGGVCPVAMKDEGISPSPIAPVPATAEPLAETAAPELETVGDGEEAAATASAKPAPRPVRPVRPTPAEPVPKPAADRETTAPQAQSKAAAQVNATLASVPGNLPTPGKSGPQIWVETVNLDLGLISNAARTEYDLKLANRGTEPLVISNVRTTCGCTAADINEKEIAPGKEVPLHLIIDPRKIHGFESKKTVTVFSNDPEDPRVQISVRCEIKPEFEIEPENIDFGDVKKGETKEATLIFRQLQDEPELVVQDVSVFGEYAGLDLSFEKRPASEWKEPGKVEYLVTVRLTPNVPPGPFVGRFRIQNNCQRMPSANVYARANVQAFYSFSPRSVVLHNQQPGGASTKPRVVVKGEEPFQIENVTPGCKDFTATVRPGERLNERYIELELTPEARMGTYTEQLTFQVIAEDGTAFDEVVSVRLLVRKEGGTRTPPPGGINRQVLPSRLVEPQPAPPAPPQTGPQTGPTAPSGN